MSEERLSERLSYRFGPLERRGLLGPLRLGQAVAVGAALALGVALLDRIGGGGGVAAAILLLAVAVILTTVPVTGRTVEQWAPVAGVFLARDAAGWRRFRSKIPTSGSAAAESPKLELPHPLTDVRLVSVEHRGRVLGALSERRGRRLTAVLACRAVSFALLDPEVQERRLAQWGTVLAGRQRADPAAAVDRTHGAGTGR